MFKTQKSVLISGSIVAFVATAPVSAQSIVVSKRDGTENLIETTTTPLSNSVNVSVAPRKSLSAKKQVRKKFITNVVRREPVSAGAEPALDLSNAAKNTPDAKMDADKFDSSAVLSQPAPPPFVLPKEVVETPEQTVGEALANDEVIQLYELFFDTGEATLKDNANTTLNILADALRLHPELNVIIEGHTDNRGGADYNLALSQARAESVVAALIDRGISADRLVALGQGLLVPKATNDTAEGRAQNRRVEVRNQNS